MKNVAGWVLALALAGPAIAQDEQRHMPHTDDLLHFDWLSDDQRQRIDDAHAQLAEANAEMCDVMVDTYAEHATRVHENDIADGELAYLKRACAAKSFANHIELSVELHDRIHREVHATDGHGH